MSDFWIPRFRWQLVSWLEKHYPGDKSFKRKSKKQLMAIYLSVRSKM